MAPIPDPEQSHFFVEHMGKVLIATAGIILGMVKVLKGSSKQGQAEMACDIIKDNPVLHADLLQCKLDVNSVIDHKFELMTDHTDKALESMERTIVREVRNIHKRVDTCQKNRCTDKASKYYEKR